MRPARYPRMTTWETSMSRPADLPFLSNAAPTTSPALLARAKAAGKPARIAIAGADSELPMQSAKQAVEEGIMEPVFCGNPEKITSIASSLNWDISAFETISATSEAEAATTAFLAAREGRVGAVLKGHVHTDQLMKAALNRETGIRDGKRFVHIFHISAPNSDRAIMVSDGAVNVAPDMDTKKVAIEEVVRLAHALGIEIPKVALLSATEEPIPSVPSAVEARQLQDWAAEHISGAVVKGPFALDLILSPDAASVKGLSENAVAGGKADAVIVPDIVSGNVLFKALVYMRGGCAGGIVMGGKVPILLTSRADPPAARLASICLAGALQNA